MKAFTHIVTSIATLLLCDTARAQTNTEFGTQALNSVTTGTDNLAVGDQAVFSLT